MGSRNEENVKDVDRESMKGNEARKRWAEYFGSFVKCREMIEKQMLQ